MFSSVNQAKLLGEIGLFIDLSFCLRFNFAIYTCQPETGYHYSDSCLFKISFAITSELLTLSSYYTCTASAPMSLSQALEKQAHQKNEPMTFMR